MNRRGSTHGNMENQYEVTFIMTPVLSDSEVKKTAKKYAKLIKSNGGTIVDTDHWGLKQMAYPIRKRTTGIYHLIEFTAPTESIDPLELEFRRDESILRFLTVRLDKYAVEYNEKKRAGLVGRKKNRSEEQEESEA